MQAQKEWGGGGWGVQPDEQQISTYIHALFLVLRSIKRQLKYTAALKVVGSLPPVLPPAGEDTNIIWSDASDYSKPD